MLWGQDDIMEPNTLRQFFEFINNFPDVGMIYSNFYTINRFGVKTYLENRHIPQRIRTPQISNPEISALLFFYFGCLPGNISTVMLNKNSFINLGGFNENMTQAPDYEMWVRISEKYTIGYINEKLVALRDHEKQQSKIGHKDMRSIKEDFFVYNILLNRLKNCISKAELTSYFFSHRGMQQIQWLFNALLKGNLNSVILGIRYIKKYGNLRKQIFYWLISFNGRFFIKQKHEVYDKIIIKNKSYA